MNSYSSMTCDDENNLRLAQGSIFDELRASQVPSLADSDIPGEETRLAVLEAVLFVADAPLPLARLHEACPWPREILEGDLRRLQAGRAGHGVELRQIAGAWQLATSPAVSPWVESFLKVDSRQRLGKAQLETLALVAYRQPVTRAEIDSYRGVKCERLLSQLEDLHLIRRCGRANMPGHPFLYATTADFLEAFALNSLDDLPPIGETEDAVAAAEPSGESGEGAHRPHEGRMRLRRWIEPGSSGYADSARRADTDVLADVIASARAPLPEVPAVASDSAELTPQENDESLIASLSGIPGQTEAEAEPAENGARALSPSAGLRHLLDKIKQQKG